MAQSLLREFVLDASSLLALRLREPGDEVVHPLMAAGVLGAINLAEVASRLIDRGDAAEDVLGLARGLDCRIADFDTDLAPQAGLLRRPTRQFGLSLGDRACLALAQREGLPVLTADKAWADLDVGVEVVLIR